MGDCINNPAEPGTLITSIPLTGLPGSTTGMPEGFVVTLDASMAPIPVPDGPIGWSYGATDLSAGPLLITVGADPTGTVDFFDLYDGGCLGTAQFIDPITMAPQGVSSFYLELIEDDGGVACAAPVKYGTADTSTQGNVASIDTTGGLPSVANPNFTITLAGGNPNQGCILLESMGQGSTPTAWGTLLVASPFVRIPNMTDGAGAASYVVPSVPGMAGMTFFY